MSENQDNTYKYKVNREENISVVEKGFITYYTNLRNIYENSFYEKIDIYEKSDIMTHYYYI